MSAQAPAAAPPDYSKVEIQSTQLAPNFYRFEAVGPVLVGNAGAFIGPDGVFLVDAMFTQLNDKLETAALKKCFNSHAEKIPMSSTKSMIGHPQGACGAAGVAATILSMRARHVHPTINLDTPDPECDLDYVPNTARKHDADIALCNCIAFGSKNSALILRRSPD